MERPFNEGVAVSGEASRFRHFLHAVLVLEGSTPFGSSNPLLCGSLVVILHSLKMPEVASIILNHCLNRSASRERDHCIPLV